MSIDIKTQADAFKFSLTLFDYLSQQGHAREAEELAALVDSCYPTDVEAIEAHRQAFHKIKESHINMPDSYREALNDALDILGSR